MRGQVASLLGALLAAYATLLIWHGGRTAWGIAFYQFWAGGRVAGRPDIGDFYSAQTSEAVGREFLERSLKPDTSLRWRAVATRRQHLEFGATPFFFSIFHWAASVDFERDYLWFRAGSVVLGLLGLGAFGLRAGLGLEAVLALVALVMLSFEPLSVDVSVGNVSLIQLGLLAFATLSVPRRREVLQVVAGVSLGLVVLFKPTVVGVPFAILVAERALRRYRRATLLAVGLSIGVVLAVVASAAVFGTVRVWVDWLNGSAAIQADKTSVAAGNVAMGALVREVLAADISVPLAALIACGTGAIIWRDARRGLADGLLYLRAISLGLLGWLVASPLVWLHYLVLALPAVCCLLRPMGRSEGTARATGRQGLGLLALGLLAMYPALYLGFELDMWRKTLLANIGLAVLLVAFVWDAASPGAPMPPVGGWTEAQ